MLLSEVEIFIYKVDNYTFELLGTVNKYSSLIWPNKFVGYGTFELWAVLDEENKELLKPGNIVWIGTDNACVIENVNPQKTESGIKKIYVKGRSLEKFLEERIIWGTYVKSGYVSDILYDIVNKCCINPTDGKRKIPYLENAQIESFGESLSVQKTGGYVYDFLVDMVEDSNIGFGIDFLPREKKLRFKVLQGANRTTTNVEGNLPIELSTEFDDVLASEYNFNNQNFKNIAFIQGEENEGEPRRSTSIGSISLSGFDRKEFYVDARDIQSEVYIDEKQERIPDPEYIKMLQARGMEKLSERVIEENFSIDLRQKGILQYELGVDYFIGDLITLKDNDLGIVANVQLTQVDFEFSDTYNLRVNFGKSRPTIMERLKSISK